MDWVRWAFGYKAVNVKEIDASIKIQQSYRNYKKREKSAIKIQKLWYYYSKKFEKYFDNLYWKQQRDFIKKSNL